MSGPVCKACGAKPGEMCICARMAQEDRQMARAILLAGAALVMGGAFAIGFLYVLTRVFPS